MVRGHPDFKFSAYVQTLAADNIVLDKLTVGATYPNRRWLKNDGGIPNLFTSALADPAICKRFARGSRGYLIMIYIFCKNEDTVDHTVYVKLGPIIGTWVQEYEKTIGFGFEGWLMFTYEDLKHAPYEYDSCFIQVWSDSELVKFGYDEEEPWDSYQLEAGAWSAQRRRYVIRLFLSLNVGDLPVSGTMNVVEIPSSSLGAVPITSGTVSPRSSLVMIDYERAGFIELLILTANHYLMGFQILIDGAYLIIPYIEVDEVIDYKLLEFDRWKAQIADVGVGNGIILTKYDTTNNYYCFIINRRYPVRKKLKIVAFNRDTVASHDVNCQVHMGLLC